MLSKLPHSVIFFLGGAIVVLCGFAGCQVVTERGSAFWGTMFIISLIDLGVGVFALVDIYFGIITGTLNLYPDSQENITTSRDGVEHG